METLVNSPKIRYGTEVMRALDVLDKQLEGKSYLCGDDYTIADMAWLPWVRCK